MYNTRGVKDCGELLEISQQRYTSQTERCRRKMQSLFGNTSKSNLKTEIELKHWMIISDLPPLTLVLIKEQ